MSEEKKTRKQNPVVVASRELAAVVAHRDKLKERALALTEKLDATKKALLAAETEVKAARRIFDETVAGTLGS